MATDEHADKKRKADTLTGEAVETSEVEVRKMVQTLSFDQLSNLVVAVCVKNTDACAMLHEAWSRDLNNRKLYIRNLNVRACVRACVCVCVCVCVGLCVGLCVYVFLALCRHLPGSSVGLGSSVRVDHYSHCAHFLHHLYECVVPSIQFETTTESLTAAFAPYGTLVDCAVIMDKATGRNKGYVQLRRVGREGGKARSHACALVYVCHARSDA
jgi:hypothetical protein